jgi:DNA-binding winged helix-turn-helix (wHTH) protein
MSRQGRFSVKRDDGRTNIEVVIAIFEEREPGEIITYDELIAALSEGVETVYNRQAVQSIVTKNYTRILASTERAITNVPNVGYRVVPASSHITIAGDRKERADRQIAHGFETLRHVRWNEMDENQRRAHEGQLMIMSGLHAQMQAIDARQRRLEDLLRGFSAPGDAETQG